MAENYRIMSPLHDEKMGELIPCHEIQNILGNFFNSILFLGKIVAREWFKHSKSVMSWTPFHPTSNELKHHFSNI